MIFDIIEEIIEERRKKKLRGLLNDMKQESILNIMRKERMDVISGIQERAYRAIKEQVIDDVNHHVELLEHDIKLKVKVNKKELTFDRRRIEDFHDDGVILRINLDVTKEALLSYIKNKERENEE